MPSAPLTRPIDATLSVTKAARLLGVHPNTVRAWSDAGRLRYYRINPRGDRRYRLGDLQRFLAAAENAPGRRAGSARGIADRPAAAAPRSAAAARALASTAARSATDASASAAGPISADRRRPDPDRGRSRDARRGPPPGVPRASASAYGLHLVAVWELRGDRLVPRGDAARRDPPGRRSCREPTARSGAAARARRVGRSGRRSIGDGPRRCRRRPPAAIRELAVAIPGDDGPWGVLAPRRRRRRPDRDRPGPPDRASPAAVGVDRRGRAPHATRSAHRLHRAEALRRVASDIGSRLDLDRILAGLVDHAMVLFEGDRGGGLPARTATAGRRPRSAAACRPRYLASVRDFPARSLPAAAVAARRPLFAVDYRDDPRGERRPRRRRPGGLRHDLHRAAARRRRELLGLLNVYHDPPHDWTDGRARHDGGPRDPGQRRDPGRPGLRADGDLGRPAPVDPAARRAAQPAGTSVDEIGIAIATELRQLIDYHNVRVYRLARRRPDPGRDAGPGRRVRRRDARPAAGRARRGHHRLGRRAPRSPRTSADAAADPRANTIPGTEDDLDESMLLAPMIFEDQVLGVLVLSKLGLHQFTDDDLRLLVIYASFAAQAMANADTTEPPARASRRALERQLAQPARAPRRSPSRS